MGATSSTSKSKKTRQGCLWVLNSTHRMERRPTLRRLRTACAKTTIGMSTNMKRGTTSEKATSSWEYRNWERKYPSRKWIKRKKKKNTPKKKKKKKKKKS